jgi:hypothetical protein
MPGCVGNTLQGADRVCLTPPVGSRDKQQHDDRADDRDRRLMRDSEIFVG